MAQIATKYSIHPNVITKWRKAALSAMPNAFDEQTQKAVNALKAQHQKEKEQLYAQIGRLTTQLNWLKKKLEASVSVSTRQSWIDWQAERELAIKGQAALLGLNRSGLYYKPKQPNQREIDLKRRIDEIYTACPFYGSRRIKAQLQSEGRQVNRKMVQRCMDEMGLAGLIAKPNLSRRGKEHKIYPYLLSGVKISKPLQVFGTDTTYIRLKYGWLYLVAMLDWHSRYIVSWELDQTLEIEFVLKAVERAVAGGGPEIFNSDQGSHFTSPKYIQLVEGAGSRVSMDGKGRAFDNIFTERLWKTIKYECFTFMN